MNVMKVCKISYLPIKDLDQITPRESFTLRSLPYRDKKGRFCKASQSEFELQYNLEHIKIKKLALSKTSSLSNKCNHNKKKINIVLEKNSTLDFEEKKLLSSLSHVESNPFDISNDTDRLSENTNSHDTGLINQSLNDRKRYTNYNKVCGQLENSPKVSYKKTIKSNSTLLTDEKIDKTMKFIENVNNKLDTSELDSDIRTKEKNTDNNSLDKKIYYETLGKINIKQNFNKFRKGRTKQKLNIKISLNNENTNQVSYQNTKSNIVNNIANKTKDKIDNFFPKYIQMKDLTDEHKKSYISFSKFKSKKDKQDSSILKHFRGTNEIDIKEEKLNIDFKEKHIEEEVEREPSVITVKYTNKPKKRISIKPVELNTQDYHSGNSNKLHRTTDIDQFLKTKLAKNQNTSDGFQIVKNSINKPNYDDLEDELCINSYTDNFILEEKITMNTVSTPIKDSADRNIKPYKRKFNIKSNDSSQMSKRIECNSLKKNQNIKVNELDSTTINISNDINQEKETKKCNSNNKNQRDIKQNFNVQYDHADSICQVNKIVYCKKRFYENISVCPKRKKNVVSSDTESNYLTDLNYFHENYENKENNKNHLKKLLDISSPSCKLNRKYTFERKKIESVDLSPLPETILSPLPIKSPKINRKHITKRRKQKSYKKTYAIRVVNTRSTTLLLSLRDYKKSNQYVPLWKGVCHTPQPTHYGSVMSYGSDVSNRIEYKSNNYYPSDPHGTSLPEHCLLLPSKVFDSSLLKTSNFDIYKILYRILKDQEYNQRSVNIMDQNVQHFKYMLKDRAKYLSPKVDQENYDVNNILFKYTIKLLALCYKQYTHSRIYYDLINMTKDESKKTTLFKYPFLFSYIRDPKCKNNSFPARNLRYKEKLQKRILELQKQNKHRKYSNKLTYNKYPINFGVILDNHDLEKKGLYENNDIKDINLYNKNLMIKFRSQTFLSLRNKKPKHIPRGKSIMTDSFYSGYSSTLSKLIKEMYNYINSWNELSNYSLIAERACAAYRLVSKKNWSLREQFLHDKIQKINEKTLSLKSNKLLNNDQVFVKKVRLLRCLVRQILKKCAIDLGIDFLITYRVPELTSANIMDINLIELTNSLLIDKHSKLKDSFSSSDIRVIWYYNINDWKLHESSKSHRTATWKYKVRGPKLSRVIPDWLRQAVVLAANENLWIPFIISPAKFCPLLLYRSHLIDNNY